MALRGIKVIEFAGLAPAPFCGMILRDHGASVTRIDRPGADINVDSLSRGKRSFVIDLKNSKSASVVSRLCSNADVLLEPFRPGVMEKYKLGPSELCKINPRLIYARLTGFGQNGPFSKMAGHDINYIAISGVLSVLGRSGEKPSPPINLLGDFAGGGLICALGICLALLERQKSGKGQVIDANMVEGSAYVSSWLWSTRKEGFPIPLWANSKGKNVIDGGSHFYQTYETKDGKYMAVGALEPQFYRALMKGLGIDENEYSQFSDWEETTKKFSEIFLTKTQEEWCEVFNFTDACVTPVVPLEESHKHIHNIANKSFITNGKESIPVPAPRLSRTPGDICWKIPASGEHTLEILLEEGFTKSEIDSLVKGNVVYSASAKSSL
ncbi:alpha-methylacyl-CoA racemase-like [Stegodyphus dumicola]|uniref:alpha-methylacyl-CoA racemase-like n=1 Tax=Stegodyphus dumicola TaxID=202533 RepID=UPI0015AA60B6|nr:alpha-methylacyl-CoA racemase-like [Stegodyphus dumicola]